MGDHLRGTHWWSNLENDYDDDTDADAGAGDDSNDDDDSKVDGVESTGTSDSCPYFYANECQYCPARYKCHNIWGCCEGTFCDEGLQKCVPTMLSPSSEPTLAPSLVPTTSQPSFVPTNHPSLTPTLSPFPALIPKNDPTIVTSSPQGTAIFLTAFVALASLFVYVRRGGKEDAAQAARDIRNNRKFATRQSITTFMKKLASTGSEFFIDPHRLDLGRVIGVGSHGVVYEGLYQGQDVAVKELVLESDAAHAKDSEQRFLQEIIALNRLDHPNVVELMGVGSLPSPANPRLFTFFFVMELAEASLREILQDDMQRFRISSVEQAVDLLKQVCDGGMHIHNKGLIHFDIKPENILVSGDGVAKICDLGLSEIGSRSHKDGTSDTDMPLHYVQEEVVNEEGEVDPLGDLQGTAPYIAPELINDYRPDVTKYVPSFAADIYSFGILFWEVLHAPLPTHPLHWDSYRILLEAKYNLYRPQVDEAFPAAITDLIQSCWAEDPGKRPTFAAIRQKLDTPFGGRHSSDNPAFSCDRAEIVVVGDVEEAADLQTGTAQRERNFSRSEML